MPTSSPTITYDDAKHEYTINGELVPSVTQILDRVSPKPALTWWGMRVGFHAVLRLLQDERLSALALLAYDAEDHLSGKPVNSPEQAVRRGRGARAKLKTPLEAAVIEAKLDTNNIRDAKADIGTAVHDAITKVGVEDKLIPLDTYQPEVKGYMRAFARFWFEQDPTFIAQELIVASVEYRYAGRFDLIAEISGKRWLLDFKSSGGLYTEYSEQLRLYELAYLEEPDAEPFHHLGLVHLTPQGEYELRTAYTSKRTALAAIELYHARAEDDTNKPKAWR
jgi:hypothetical protein